MKYFKILLLLLISFSSASHAELIHNVTLFDHRNYCITNDYYVKNRKLYYFDIASNRWRNTSTKDYSSTFIHGYVYDTDTKECKAEEWVIMGMEATQFYFLLGLIGLLFGGVFMFFTTQIFTTVGGKR